MSNLSLDEQKPSDFLPTPPLPPPPPPFESHPKNHNESITIIPIQQQQSASPTSPSPPLTNNHNNHQHDNKTEMKNISMAINQLSKQNENDMNSNNCQPSGYSDTISESAGNADAVSQLQQQQPSHQQNVYSNFLKEYSNKILNNVDRDVDGNHDMTTTDGVQFPIQGSNGTSWVGGGSGGSNGFEYVTYHGNVIRSVVPPGRGSAGIYTVRSSQHGFYVWMFCSQNFVELSIKLSKTNPIPKNYRSTNLTLVHMVLHR